MGPTLAELRLANDLGTLGVVRAYTRELAALASLSLEDTAALVWAVEAAVTDIIAHGFDAGESSTLAVTAELTPVALTIAVHERGLPFDPSRIEADGEPPADDTGPTAARAPLWRHIRRAVDQARWFNRGPDGMELRLTKARPTRDPFADITPEAPAAPRSELPLAPPQRYTIRRLDPHEAIQVSQVIYRVYGYSYPNSDLYYADRIVHLNETGELVSVVAVDEAGVVVGHYALERPGLGPVAEAGQAVVAPAHRDRKLMEQMHACLEREGQRLGGIGPGFAADGDVLRLQYLTVPVDSGRLQILSPFGRELLAYVDAERERVGRDDPARP
jgi:anti-sigma regulatory factor (Ser/Thr protein kinase)